MIAPPPGAGLLTARSAVYAVGTGAYLAGSAVFFTHYLGFSVIQVGIGLSVQGAVVLLTKVPLGVVTDRIGGRRAWMLGVTAQAGLFAVYPFAGQFPTFMLVMAIVGLASTLADNGRMKYTADALEPGQRVRTTAYLKSVQNVGFTIGTALAGLAMAVNSPAGYLALFYGNAASFALELLLLAMFTSAAADKRTPSTSRTAPSLRDVPFLTLSLINGVFMLNDPLLLAVLPLWIVQFTDAPRVMISVTLIVNMVMTVFFQVWASRNTEGVEGAARAQRRAGWALAGTCAVLAASQFTHGYGTTALLVAGVLLLTLGELFASAGAWGLRYALAPEQRQAEYFATFGLGWQLSSMLGPALMLVLVTASPVGGWIVLAVVFLANSASVLPATRWASRTPRLVPVEVG